MIDIFLLQWQRLRRRPFMVLAMIAMTVVFIMFIGGSNTGENQSSIPVYVTEEVDTPTQEALMEELQTLEGFRFYLDEWSNMKEEVALGDVVFGVELAAEHYTFLISTENEYQSLVDNHLRTIYQEKLLVDQLTNEVDREALAAELENPPIEVNSETEGIQGSSLNDQLHVLFGMTLFFAIYTIVFSLGEVAEEKQRGSWDRLILSPVRKWQLYVGHVSYAFVIGYLQICFVFLMFAFVFDIMIGASWPAVLLIAACYTLAIVSLGMLLIGLVQKASQLNAVIPLVAVSMAMLGGAYWPLEVVSNNIVRMVAELIPVKHAMEALKDVTMYGESLLDVTQPLAILLLMSVLFMGVGINLMERR
ncbi:ABC transporter permease [Virgibacillus sp. NKC19-3]|uniref:ABC transporter permease n=1 Tax=Virgibacillus saliphilus TaxID=2831674 RepID=UPI001C9BBB8E|nr:ABC transporter permease [Virgibacillus sp. NKC19-3]MBY7142981.1 ABC transporter permease [Virgibacillus sp. NKC19-3]